MSESIVLVLQGGLGNQLFQYAAGVLTSSYLGGTLWLLPAENNRHSSVDYRPLFRSGKGIGIDSEPSTPPEILVWVGAAFQSWNPHSFGSPLPPSILLKGYFQHLPSLSPVLPRICAELHATLQPLRATLQQEFAIQSATTAFVHIRRGDYLEKHTEHWVQDKEYYISALSLLHEKRAPKRWILLSDDPDWCEAQDWLTKAPMTFEMIRGADELQSLVLMSLCEAGAVLANSTFSWWGAILGAAAVGAPVVYPRRWYKDECPTLFPAEWIAAGPEPPKTSAPNHSRDK